MGVFRDLWGMSIYQHLSLPRGSRRNRTIVAVIINEMVVVQDKVLDPLLLLPVGLLLRAHGDGQAGVGRQLDRARLLPVALSRHQAEGHRVALLALPFAAFVCRC